jgi:hypothetical protein
MPNICVGIIAGQQHGLHVHLILVVPFGEPSDGAPNTVGTITDQLGEMSDLLAPDNVKVKDEQ